MNTYRRLRKWAAGGANACGVCRQQGGGHETPQQPNVRFWNEQEHRAVTLHCSVLSEDIRDPCIGMRGGGRRNEEIRKLRHLRKSPLISEWLADAATIPVVRSHSK